MPQSASGSQPVISICSRAICAMRIGEHANASAMTMATSRRPVSDFTSRYMPAPASTNDASSATLYISTALPVSQ